MQSSNLNFQDERYYIRPSIIIGLGGTGTEICLKLKKLIKEKIPIDIPLIQFLIFDTDITDKIDIKKTDNKISTINQIKTLFSPNEYHHLTVRNIEEIIKNYDKHPHIFSWFPKDIEIKDILNGANQIRIFGRMALYWNILAVIDAIKRAKSKVLDLKNETILSNLGYDIQRGNIAVYIMHSLCGGSGSGMFIDMGYIVQYLIENCEINAYSVMPSIFQIEQQASINANAYAALKELNYFMSGGEFKLNLGQQYEPHTFKTRPFDRCYIIDSWTESNLHIENLDDLCDIIAKVAFKDILCMTGKRHRSVLDNLKTKLTHKICNQVSAYSSFGFSSICFDSTKAKKACAYMLAEEFFSNFIKSSDKKVIKNHVNEFIRINKINEEITDDVITFMAFDGTNRIKINKNPSDFDNISTDNLLSSINQWYSECKNIYMPSKYQIMDQNLEKLTSIVSKNLNDEVEKILSNRNLGLNYAEQFLSSLEINLQSFAEMLENEILKIRDQKKRLMITIKANHLAELLGSFFSYILYRAKIYEARNDLIFDMTNDINFDIEIYIRELAIKFYKNICNQINEIMSKQINIIKNFILTSEKEFEKRVCEILNQRLELTEPTEKKIKWNASEIKKLYEKYSPKNIEDIINNFLNTISGPITNWNVNKLNELSEKILHYCESYFECFDKITIMDLISEEQNGNEIIENLINLSSPLWLYSTSEMPHGTIIDEITIITISEECKTMLLKFLKDSSKIIFDPIINNHKITITRFRHGLPIFALFCIKRDLKPAYEMFKSGAFNSPTKPLHIDNQYYNLPEIVN